VTIVMALLPVSARLMTAAWPVGWHAHRGAARHGPRCDAGYVLGGIAFVMELGVHGRRMLPELAGGFGVAIPTAGLLLTVFASECRRCTLMT